MFRWLIAILLLIAFAAQSFSQMLIVAEYYTNIAAFAQQCENKVRPQLKCQGKCQMMKKLQNEEKKSERSPDIKGSIKAEVISSKSFFAQVPIANFVMDIVYPSQKPNICPPGKATEIFHPPLLF